MKTLTMREAFQWRYGSDQRPSPLRQYESALRAWERFTADPPIGEITSDTFDDFRAAALVWGNSDVSVTSYVVTFQAVLRAAHKAGLTGSVPAFRHLIPASQRKRTRCVELGHLSKAYDIGAASVATPQGTLPTATWWRLLFKLQYGTGLRPRDLLRLRLSQVDFRTSSLTVHVRKFNAVEVCPMPGWAVEPLRQVERRPDSPIFGDFATRQWRQFYRELEAVAEAAGVPRFTLLDVRRTITAEIDRVSPGIGRLLLGRQRRVRTDDENQVLRAALEAVPVPESFTGR